MRKVTLDKVSMEGALEEVRYKERGRKLACRELGEESSGQRGSRCTVGRERAWCVGRLEEWPGTGESG